MNTRLCLVPLLVSIGLFNAGARADVLPPAQDSSSLKGKLTLVTGRATTLPVSATRKGFVLFNLNNLPEDVLPGDIAQARLRVYFPSAPKPGDIAIHTVTGAWDEKTTAPEPGVSASPIAMLPLASVVGKKFVEVDVTATVQAWRAGQDVNNGFAFLATGKTSVVLGAKEGAGSGYPCELEVEIDRAIGHLSITDSDVNTLIDVTNNGGGGALHGLFGSTTGTASGVLGESNSTSSNAAGVTGVITSTSPGGFSAGVRGINNSTGGLGIGVYGSQNGTGWGVYGFSPSGIGVRGGSTDGFGVYGQSTSGFSIYGVQPVNGTTSAGYFQNNNTVNASPTLVGITNGTGVAIQGSQSGNGGAGAFTITNAGNGSPALFASTDGTGHAITGNQVGTGRAGNFVITNATNSAAALLGSTNGTGPAVSAVQSGTGGGGLFTMTSASNSASAITVNHAGTGAGVTINLTNPSSGGYGLSVQQSGVGHGIVATSAGGHGVLGIASNISAAGVIGENSLGEAVVGITLSSSSNPSYDGSTTGAVVGRNDLLNGIGVRGYGTKTGGVGLLGQGGVSNSLTRAGRFENINSSNTSDVLQVASISTCNLAVFQKSGSNVARIDSTGKGFFNGGTQTGGADVAEVIPSTGPQPTPGDVVEIDPEHPLHYRLSSSANTTMVAGVITTLPGVLMNKAADNESVAPALALVGRVPVKIVGEGGAVRPGDLLVASSTPGHAMRAPADVKPGTVIGKALEPFSGEEGTIEMLVMTR